MNWQGWAELATALVIAVPLLLVAWFVLRRRMLAWRGPSFSCSARLRGSTPSTGWVLGVARYSGEELEWYALFALGLRPRLRYSRTQTQAVGQRPALAEEEPVLRDDAAVLTLETRGKGPDDRSVELAMSPQARTGLLSWLEAAPPGEGRYGQVVGPVPS